MRVRWPRLAACLGIGLVIVGWAGTAASTDLERPRVEFWTIEPNEGLSAGGHSALRIADTLYHVEHRGDGLVVDRRDSLAEFERIYRREGNRSIEVLRLELPDAVGRSLVRLLRQRYFDRRQRLDGLVGLEAEEAWLERTLERGYASVFVPGLGVLDPNPSDCADSTKAPLARLRAEVETRLDPGRLADRLASARRALERARDRLMTPAGALAASSESGSHELEPGGAVRRLWEAAQTLAALEAVRDCRPPKSERLRVLGEEAATGARGRSSGPDAATLAARRGLLDALARLVESDRADPGLALILTWGRLVALEATLETGRIHVLDPVAESEEPTGFDSAAAPPSWIEASRSTANAAVARRLAELADASRPLEERFSRLEWAVHERAHAERSERHHGPVPDLAFATMGSVAARYAGTTFSLAWPEEVRIEEIEMLHGAALARARRLRRDIDRDFGYALFSRNCVTELLSVLDEAMRADPATTDFASERARDFEAGLGFIPVVAGRIVARHAPVAEKSRRPSWREAELDRARREGAGFWGALRETNTLTTRTYRSHDGDSTFLFFTRRPVWARPLVGVGNLVAGVGSATAGLLTAPVDRGRLLLRGLRGVAMSLPELFFFNVRKGSYVVAPPEATSRMGQHAFEDDGT